MRGLAAALLLVLVLGLAGVVYAGHLVGSAPARHAVATAAQPGLPMWD